MLSRVLDSLLTPSADESYETCLAAWFLWIMNNWGSVCGYDKLGAMTALISGAGKAQLPPRYKLSAYRKGGLTPFPQLNRSSASAGSYLSRSSPRKFCQVPGWCIKRPASRGIVFLSYSNSPLITIWRYGSQIAWMRCREGSHMYRTVFKLPLLLHTP